MSVRFHFNPKTGKSGVCTATTRECAFGSADTHGNSREQAQARFEESMANKEIVTLSKKEQEAKDKSKARGIANPEANRIAIEIARSNASGTHDTRPHRERSRENSKKAAIRDQKNS